MARVVLCPDSFKGSVSARDVALALAEGWQRHRPADEVVVVPQADGGEGTTEAYATARPSGRWHEVAAVGADGAPVTGRWYEHDGIAVCELAQVAGLPSLTRPDPLGATSRGLGQVIADAAAAGLRAIHVGLGGSASTDGGAGALRALGFEATDAAGAPLRDGGGALVGLTDLRRPHILPRTPIVVLTDVTSPLLGPTGAAAVFAPQKGADADQVMLLERGLQRWAALLGGPTDQPGMGAAGGLGYGLVAGLGATLTDGAAWVSHHTGLDDAIATADLVITGEGRFDRTSLQGKVVGHVLDLSRTHGVSVQVVAGQAADLGPDSPPVTTLVARAGSVDAAVADPARWLAEIGTELARRCGREGSTVVE